METDRQTDRWTEGQRLLDEDKQRYGSEVGRVGRGRGWGAAPASASVTGRTSPFELIGGMMAAAAVIPFGRRIYAALFY